MLKQIHAQIRNQIPENVTVYAEWCYAKHSIHYTGELALRSLLRLFGVHDDSQKFWYSWQDVEALSLSLGLDTVPVIGKFSFNFPAEVVAESGRLQYGIMSKGHEGFVFRSAGMIPDSDFSTNIGKWVRPNHVQTDDHWSKSSIVKNEVSPTGI